MRADGTACTCPTSDGPPTRSDDCRLTDPDGDGVLGVRLAGSRMRSPDLSARDARLVASLAGTKAVAWRLRPEGDAVRGEGSSGLALRFLGLTGDIESGLRNVRSASCSEDVEALELVRGDYDCAALVRARAVDPDTLGLFDPNVGRALPSPAQCSDPDCAFDRDRDGTVDCRDACPTDPDRVAPDGCGCGEQSCEARLLGDYAARSTVYLSIGAGADPGRTFRVVSYSLLHVQRETTGQTTLREQPCWSIAVPSPGNPAPALYSWTAPNVSAASEPAVRRLERVGDTSWVATSATAQVGYARTACASGALPPEWPASWGASCRCEGEAESLPVYDRDASPYDCRLTDPDGDGYPGLSLLVATSLPPTPTFQPSPSEVVRFMLAADSGETWRLGVQPDRRHRGSVETSYRGNIVGCVGAGCVYMPMSAGPIEPCPGPANEVELTPVETLGVGSCEALLAQRGTLFPSQDATPWPAPMLCPE